MKFLLLSPDGEGLGFLYRIKEEGNDVRVWFPSTIDKESIYSKGKMVNMIPQINSLAELHTYKPDVVIVDTSCIGKWVDANIKPYFKVIGASAFADKLELDRIAGFKFMEICGIDIPPTYTFKNLNEAMTFVEKQDDDMRLVLKPVGSADCSFTYVGKDANDMICHIDTLLKERPDVANKSCVLQEFKKGIEISTEAFFSHGKLVMPYFHTMEVKGFMSGDLGVKTGCAWSIEWVLEQGEPKSVQKGLGKVIKAMEQFDYTGNLDLNAIFVPEEDKFYGLEWTPRFGYNSHYCQLSQIGMECGKLYYDLAYGNISEISIRDKFAGAVRVTVPPYPLDVRDRVMRHKIYQEFGNEKVDYRGNPKNVWWLDVARDKEGDMVTVGVDGIVCEIASGGRDIYEVKQRVKENLILLNIPNIQYRDDMFKRAENEQHIIESYNTGEKTNVGEIGLPH